VLFGEMSLVGQRPAIPYEVREYDHWHLERIFPVKPGITGIWQVEGRSRTSFDDMVRMDINYIRRWSVMMDLKLILKTPFSMLSAKGAY
jgi:lipopolysaccharide/colanic/teichoic acid biosynthesis glycosyltransferase